MSPMKIVAFQIESLGLSLYLSKYYDRNKNGVNMKAFATPEPTIPINIVYFP